MAGESSGMAGFTVTPEMVLTGSRDAKAVADEIWLGLGQLQQYVLGLGGLWQGVAKLTFDELMVRWNQDAQQLYDALLGISAGLQGNSLNYVQHETANNQVLAGVNAIMPPVRLS